MRSLVFLLLVIASEIALASTPIVYSRCPRADHAITVTADVTINGQTQSKTRQLKGLDTLDVLPDVKNFFGNFNAPCDLVLRQPDGVEKVIHDCSTTSRLDKSCAALDAAVSFDAKKITYSVFRGSLREKTESIDHRVIDYSADKRSGHVRYHPLGSYILKSAGAHICTYTIDTQTTQCTPFVAGIWDNGPAYLSNDRVAFTSTRDSHTTPVVFGTTASIKGTHVWSMDQDFRNATLIGHHSNSQEQGPLQLKNGSLAVSSWQIGLGTQFRHKNSGFGGATTIHNSFHVYKMSPYGGGLFPLYGQHSGDHGLSSFGAQHDAAHFFGQMSDGRICTADYYRGNNMGLGGITCFMQEPDGQEGIHPADAKNEFDWYVVRDAINVGGGVKPWSTNRDSTALMMPGGTYDNMIWAGKLGHPAGLPSNELMMSWGRGSCSSVARGEVFKALNKPIPPLVNGHGSGVTLNMMTSLNLDTPGCDVGVYKARTIPVEHPRDLIKIVDSPEWHEIMARAVVPYRSIYGVDKPAEMLPEHKQVDHPALPTGTPYGLLGAASVTDRETAPQLGFYAKVPRQLKAFHLQGTDTIKYDDEDIAGVRLLATLPNRSRNSVNEFSNVAGERLVILGEYSVKNVDKNGKQIIDPSGNIDTSFLVKVPANVPMFLQAIDAEGRTLNTDQTWQIVKPGEMKTCGGCHVHSKPTRIQFDQSYAATADYEIQSAGMGVVPLIDGSKIKGYGYQITFEKDIKPIFDKHCVSCHSSVNPAGGLDLSKTNVPHKQRGSTWYCLIADGKWRSCTGEGGIDRPYLSNWVVAFNALRSKLYWKAAGKRTDNDTDDTRDGDIDFGAEHKTTITDNELQILSRWIDTGATAGGKASVDTQKPTINVVAVADKNAITSLKVGVTDVGAGLDKSSLSVTVDGRTIPASIATDGVTDIPVSTLSNRDSEISVSVADLHGNIRQESFTVGYLLDQSTAVAPDPVVDAAPTPAPAHGMPVIIEQDGIRYEIDIKIEKAELEQISWRDISSTAGYFLNVSNPVPGSGSSSIVVRDVNDNIIDTYQVQIDLITDQTTGVDVTKPSLLSTTPSDGALIRGNENIILVFDENVVANSGDITISNGVDIRVIPVHDSTRVKFNGNTVTIRPISVLNAASNYHVLVGQFAIADTAGNTYAGISATTTFNFSTE